MAAINSCYLIKLTSYLAIYLLVGSGNAADATSAAVLATTTSIRSPATATERSSLDFSSAVEVEASASVESAQSARSSAGAMSYYPTDIIADIPEYAMIKELVPLMPPIPAEVRLPDTEKLVENVLLSSLGNASDSEGALRVRADTLRVMVVGDSISQGHEGDWTWRYRIWQWFRRNDIDIRFVGPYTGTVEPDKATKPQPPHWRGDEAVPLEPQTSGGYAKGADPAFVSNSNHYALWGRAAAVSKYAIQEVVEKYPADLMLVMLGFNDMGWFYSDSDGTLDSIALLVDNARLANPEMKFAIANVPHRTFINGRKDLVYNTNYYNAIFPGEISEWSTRESPVHMVDVEKYYECGTETCPSGE